MAKAGLEGTQPARAGAPFWLQKKTGNPPNGEHQDEGKEKDEGNDS